MFFILLLSASLFFMPPAWAAYFALDSWISAHKAWLSGGMFLSTAYLVPFGVSPIFEGKIKARHFAQKIADVMSNLTEDEKQTLRRLYLPKPTSHLIAWPHQIGKLESDGVLFCPGDSGLGNNEKVYCLTATALKYVEKHKKVFLEELERTKPLPY